MPAMRNTVGKVCVSATTLAALTACMSSDSTPAVRATVTQMVTAGPAANPWPQKLVYPYSQGAAPSPEFPTSLAGWEMAGAWSDMPRVFSGESWTAIGGPGGEQFPSTMNGCDSQRFLVRWRSVSSDTDVAARWNQSDVKFGTSTVGEGGWFDLDGCARPEVRHANAKPGGSTLTDVAVRVQRWIPAP